MGKRGNLGPSKNMGGNSITSPNHNPGGCIRQLRVAASSACSMTEAAIISHTPLVPTLENKMLYLYTMHLHLELLHVMLTTSVIS